MSVTEIQAGLPGQNVSNSSLEAVWIEPSELSDHWEMVKDGLEAVQKHGNHWIPEDVYTAIKTSNAVLHLFYNDEEYKGFVITTQTPSFDGMTLHIWAIYSNGQNQDFHDACFAQLNEWAKSINAKRITFYSPRKGWEKIGKRYAFEPVSMIFEREVD